MCFGTKKKIPSKKNDESQRVSPSLYFETRKLVSLGLIPPIVTPVDAAVYPFIVPLINGTINNILLRIYHEYWLHLIELNNWVLIRMIYY